METRRLMLLGQSITTQNPHVVQDDWDKENEQPEHMYDFADDSLSVESEESERSGVEPREQGLVAAPQQQAAAAPEQEAHPYPRPGPHQRPNYAAYDAERNPNYEAHDAERTSAEDIYDEKLAELEDRYQAAKDNSFSSQWVDVICGERVFKLEAELVERSPWMTKNRKPHNLRSSKLSNATCCPVETEQSFRTVVYLYGTTHFLGIPHMQAELLDRIGGMADTLMDWYRPGPGQGFTAGAYLDNPSGLEKDQLESFVRATMCVAHFTNSDRALRAAVRKAGEKLAPRLKHIREFKRWVVRHTQGLVFADTIGEAEWAHSLAA
ncbi:hypothetical protein GE09DRAFT_1240537 [Coniochaeta sp. 2T2.1]|nr:hypothetical protein GE09DRAFT_1240537 [Coniochaeta sp. 2T2.1]